MKSLTSEEINKILFFAKFQHIPITKSQLENLELDEYSLSNIQLILQHTEDSFELINQSTLKTSETETINITTSTDGFALQNREIEYSYKISKNDNNKTFYINLELLIRCLIFNL